MVLTLTGYMMHRILFIAPLALVTVAVTLVVTPTVVSSQTSSAPGEQLFRQRCQSCHSVVEGRAATLGPNLNGVLGRKAGSTDFRYSPALQGANLTWDRPTLDRYLASPAKTVPGTRMMISVANPAHRAQLIEFLSLQRQIAASE